jgi:hypothetical protein
LGLKCPDALPLAVPSKALMLSKWRSKKKRNNVMKAAIEAVKALLLLHHKCHLPLPQHLVSVVKQ